MFRPFVAALICAVLCFATRAHAKTPDHILASVKVSGCSATVFSKGPVWSAVISCRHCFGDQIGKHFYIYFPDGSRNSCTLVATDAANDLSLFRVPSDAILATAPLPETMPQDVLKYASAGYPQGFGPFYHELMPHTAKPFLPVRGVSQRWTFVCSESGIAVGGQSGSGVFADGRLIGVQSHRNTTGIVDKAELGKISATSDVEVGNELYCCQHKYLVGFIKEHRSKIADCGPLFDNRIIAEPVVVTSRFNIWSKVRSGNCENGRCPRRRSGELRTAQAPPQPRPKEWQPSPNIEIDQPLQSPKEHGPAVDLPEYDGKGKPPEGYRKPRERSKHIIDLEHLQNELELHQPEKGEQGPKGDQGPAGKDFTPPARSGHPFLAILLPCSILFGGLSLGFFGKVSAARR
jgi:hypothetical protein